MTAKVIIDKELLDNFSQFGGCNAKAKFLELYPDGLDVSGLYGNEEARRATWELLLNDEFLRSLIGFAIADGLIPNRIIGNFSSAYLDGVNLSRAYLGGVNLSRADLSGANLSGADLSGANLSGADLNGANLSGADLDGAYLGGADLDGAYLNGANLSGADLDGAYLNNIITDKITIMPKGWIK